MSWLRKLNPFRELTAEEQIAKAERQLLADEKAQQYAAWRAQQPAYQDTFGPGEWADSVSDEAMQAVLDH